MNDTLSEALKEAFAVAPKGVVYLETLEISHPDVDTIYLVRDRVNHTFTLEDDSSHEFEAAAFRMALPPSGENGLQDLTLAIDNTDRRIAEFFEAVEDSEDPITVKFRPYLSTDPTTPQMNPPLVLNLTDVSVSAVEVTGKCTFADLLNKPFPNDLYTRARFPSLAN